MNKAKVIGLIGRAGSGKDTVYEALKAALDDKTVVRVAFGDEVKREVADRHELSVETIDANKDKFRVLLQEWGMEYRRANDSAYWIKKIKPQMDMFLALADVIVITDVRFINEATYVKEVCNGSLVKVLGSKTKMLKSNHQSETEMMDITPDYLLPNDKNNLDQLCEGITFLVNELELMEVQHNEC